MSHQDLVIHNALIASTSTANALIVGDIINGPGIPIGSIVLEINYVSNGVWEILIDKDLVIEDVYATGNHMPYLDPNNPIYSVSPLVQWPTEIFITPSTSTASKTLTYKEDVKGWVSFKSFTPENAISCANEYYTFNQGTAWRHHDENVLRNTFYGAFTSNAFSSFTVVLNDSPGSVKSFNTLNYEGSQSKVTPNLQDNDYYNLNPKKGWYVDSIFTNKEKGSLNEFIEKEGKWFNYIKGEGVSHSGNHIVINPDTGDSDTWDHASFAIQGLGVLNNPPVIINLSGCMDDTMFNYNPSAVVDDGSCTPYVYGCTLLSSPTYNPAVNTDDGSCQWFGCTYGGADIISNGNTYNNVTNLTVFSDEAWDSPYGGSTIIDDGTCIDTVVGCMTFFSTNFNNLANVDDGSCIDFVHGCMISSANNYDTLVNTDDGTCTWSFCFNNLDANYNLQSYIDSSGYTASGSQYGPQDIGCVSGGCTEDASINYDPAALYDDGSCILCSSLNITFLVTVTDETVGSFNNGQIAIQNTSIDYAGPYTYELYDNTTSAVASYEEQYANQTLGGIFLQDSVLFSNVPPGDYYVVVQGANDCEWEDDIIGNDPITVNAGVGLVYGCMDSNYNNYNSAATVDDGSCAGYLGCTDPIAVNYDASATVDDGGCIYIPGCTDPTACNYDVDATEDDNSCVGVVGCMDPTDAYYDPNATCGDQVAVCDPCIYGCTDSTQLGYDSTATCDDGSCLTGVFECDCQNADNFYTLQPGETFTPDMSGGIPFTPASSLCVYTGIAGCTDPSAANYDSTATVNDCSCEANIFGCTDPTATNYDPQANLMCGIGNIYAGNITGCTNTEGVNVLINGYSNDWACNGTINFSTYSYDEGNNECCVITNISGCMDAQATNYNSSAVTDDGSCLFEGIVWGPTPNNSGVSSCQVVVDHIFQPPYLPGEMCACCDLQNGLIYDATDQNDNQSGTYTQSCSQFGCTSN